MDLVETTAAPTWPPDAVHLEYFSADPNALSGTRDAFEIVLASSGARYAVPADKSIVPGPGRERLEGEPDHRDVFLSEEEKRACDRMMLCVSRARSPQITLDL
jgi:vanillate O-demethylase ferredoxin subunit